MSIYMCGDTHGFIDIEKIRDTTIGEKDYVFICGDWGANWKKQNDEVCQWWAAQPWTTIVVLGNHDNYNIINEYPLVQWHGAPCREIVKNKIYVVERGHILTIENKTFFCFSGAKSQDISDGILDRKDFTSDREFKNKIKEYKKNMKYFKIKDVDWWEQETPTKEEILSSITRLLNFIEQNKKIDYLVTHCLDTESLDILSNILNRLLLPDSATDAINQIKYLGDFKQHFCGHYHKDVSFVNRRILTTILYNKIWKIDD